MSEPKIEFLLDAAMLENIEKPKVKNGDLVTLKWNGIEKVVKALVVGNDIRLVSPEGNGSIATTEEERQAIMQGIINDFGEEQ